MSLGVAITFRAGWHPTPESVPRARFDAALRPRISLPASVDWYSKVPLVGLHLNDEWGDCTCACDANIVQGITFYGQGTEVEVPDSVVLAAYETTGFDPNAGDPGDNPTDNGWTCADALGYLTDPGMCDVQICGHGQLGNYTDHYKVQLSLYEFGYASAGVNLPQSAMDQFNANLPWTVSGDSSLIGGHDICYCGYNSTGPVAWTWGRAQQITWAWHDTYVSELWPVVSSYWVNKATGQDPEGVDTAVLGEEFEAVLGVNPFGPSPAPAAQAKGCLPFGKRLGRHSSG